MTAALMATAAAIAAAPQAAAAVDSHDAARIARQALDSAAPSTPAHAIVFRAPRLVRAGGVVHEARLRGSGPADATGATTGRMPVVLPAPNGERAWLFYEDRAPNALFEHGGRVALVGARSGRPLVSRMLSGPPSVDGVLPRFLRSFAGYRAPYYRRGVSAAAADPSVLAAAVRSPLAAQAARQRAATLLAADKPCLVRAADTLGNFYDYAAVDHSRAAVGKLVRGLRKLSPQIVARRYRRASGTTISDYLRRTIDANGCREVSLYLAGGGYRAGGETAITLGVLTRSGGRIQRQQVTTSDLRALLRSRPTVWWNLTVDAPHAGALLEALRGEPNLASAQTSGRPGDASYVNPTRGARRGGMLEFTGGLLRGLDETLGDERAIAAALGDRDAGRASSFLAALLTRGFERGASPHRDAKPQSYTRPSSSSGSGPKSPPVTAVPIDGDPPTPPTPPVAADRAATTAEDSAVDISLARDAAQAAAATFTVVSGPAHGTLSGSGATRTYTPDPDWNGSDQLTFEVGQNGMTSNQATVTIDVAPVNDAPTIATSVTETDYPENAAATAIDPGLTIDDIDSAELSGATVRVGAGYVTGEDELEFSDQGGISGSWNAANGVLTLSGDATLADYEDALRSVGYRNESDAPAPGARPIAFRVDDGDDESAAATVNVDVAGDNDAPDVQLASGAAAYSENDPATAIDAALTVVDPDSANLASATVAITAGLQTAEDRLELTTPVTGITASYDQPTGVLTLTGPATRGDFQTALRAVGYRNTSDDPDTATRTISVTVTDSDSATGPTRSRDMTVAAVNDAPLVATGPAALAYAENDPATAIDPALTVTDVDSTQIAGATVTIASGHVEGDDELDFADAGGIIGSWDAASGALTLTGDASVADYQSALRSVTYRNASDDPPAGARSIEFRVDDGDDESAAATQTVDLAGDNDAPDLDLPGTGALAYTENDPATAIDSGLTLTDPDSATFASATVAITTGLQTGEDRLELTTPVTGITASYDEPSGVLTLTGPAPRADFQTALRAVGYRNTSDDPDTATRTISFQAKDAGGADTPTRTRDVALTAVNDAPLVTATATPLAYAENDPATALDSGLTLADVDSPTLVGATVQLTAGYVDGEDELDFPGAIGIVGSWDAPSGELTLTGPATVADYEAALRSVTYANVSDNPAAGGRSATIQVDDGDDASNVATRSIEVSTANDAPDVQLSGGTAAYTENDPATAVDSGLTVVDPDSANLASATVAITAGLQTGEDRLELTTPVTGITASYDEPTGVLTLTGPAPRADFQTALRAVGYRNTSDDPDATTRTVAFTLTDSDSATGPTRSRNVTVAAVNDAPVAQDDDGGSTDEATVLNASAPGVLDNDDDVEGDTLTVVAVEGQPANVGVATATAKGASVTVNANGSFSYDPSGSATLRALGEGETDTDTFTYAAGDGGANDTATVTITVIGLPDAPVAGDDSYSGVGNTTLTVGQTGPSGEAFKQLSGSVLDNDTDADTPLAELTVDDGTIASTLGGSATVAADGKFTYTPPAGTSGTTDSFDYSVSDGTQNDTGTVQIALSGRVWYIDNDRPSAGSGRSSSPFDTLASAVGASSAGDTLYVHQGDDTTANQNAGVTLKANQRLIGEATDLVVGSDTLFDGAPARRARIGNSAGTGVTLASGSRVEGVQVSAAGGAAIAGGAGVAGSTIADVVASGSAGGVSLSGTSGTFTISDTPITTTGGTGVAVTNAGTVQFTSAGTVSISSTAGKALDVSGTALGGTIDSLTVPSSAAGGVALLNTTGSLAFGDVSITSSGGTGFSANNAAGLSIPAGNTANVASTAGTAVDVRSSSAPALSFDNVSSTNAAGAGFNVDAVSGGSVTASGGTLSGASGAAVRVNAGNGTVTYGGTVNDGPGRPADVTARTGGAVTISGNIAEDDTGISVSGNSGGSTSFSGATKSLSTGTGTAVSLTNNGGHTVSFTGGGLALTTTSGRGFDATGGGTVDVQGTANTISSTTGTPLRVQSTTIGASDLTFRSIAANGAANGIVLDTTGASGGLNVTGSGTADSGGVIQNTVGTDGTTAGVGAYLNSTRDVSLDRMRFANHQGHAIRGISVNGLALANSTVTGTNGTNEANDEGSISLLNTTGTASIADTAIDGGYEDNVLIDSTSGTLNLALTRITVGANSVARGANGVLVIAEGNSNVTTSVTDSDFTASREDMFQHIAQGTATSDLTFTGNDLINGHSAKITGGAGMLVQAAGSQGSDLTYRIANNNVRGSRSHAIMVQKATGISNARGRITGNTIGTAGVTNSGSDEGSGIAVEARGQGSHTTVISNNTIRRFSEDGIRTVGGEDGVNDNGVVSFNITATGNLVTDPDTVPGTGAGFRSEVADSNSTTTMCLDLQGNTLTNSGTLGSDIRVFNDFPNNVFRLPGYGGGAQDQAAVISYLAGRNTAATTYAATPGSGNGYTSIASCPQPPA